MSARMVLRECWCAVQHSAAQTEVCTQHLSAPAVKLWVEFSRVSNPIRSDSSDCELRMHKDWSSLQCFDRRDWIPIQAIQHSLPSGSVLSSNPLNSHTLDSKQFGTLTDTLWSKLQKHRARELSWQKPYFVRPASVLIQARKVFSNSLSSPRRALSSSLTESGGLLTSTCEHVHKSFQWEQHSRLRQ